ncbi:MAG: hypothetical protein ACRYGF_11220 [Janthinobacterium lividum]
MGFSLRHLCLFLLLFGSVSHAQTLAHPGWRGNGIAPAAWWKHAVIVRVGTATTFARAVATMDRMSEAGADTLLLPDLQPPAAASLPFDERFGTPDDLDALLREASARHMHVVLTAPLLRLAGNSGEVRFWIARGIAGFDVGTVQPFEMDTLALLRSAVDRLPGQRLLLAHTSVPVVFHGGLTLQVVQANVRPDAGAVPAVVDLGDGAVLPSLTNAQLPMVDASVLDTEAGRERVRRMLAQRGSTHRPRAR